MTADATAWSQVLFDGLPLTAAERAGTVHLDGDRDTVGRLVRLYAGGNRGTGRIPGLSWRGAEPWVMPVLACARGARERLRGRCPDVSRT
ncbi:hypothetical protein Asi02nite_51330 [Asanoa siamensis]|uniref:Uncharacterized protein n=1 Tax=Asanoa siamensis TaxID=926357 RepID=A0ABQ4CWG3_9ACTN|nr:hypothetical protein Asi02nite_51330 [Asanoa siamensis]